MITKRSMIAFWLAGFEDEPERSGEICVAEIFGDAVGVAQVGMGIHRFRDPALTEEFAAEPLALDVAEFHTYGVDRRPMWVTFLVDGQPVRTVGQSPDYPTQLMIGIFDFPARAGAGDQPVAELVVSDVRGRPLP